MSEVRGGVSRFLHGGLKSADLQTSAAGATASRQRYDAFGDGTQMFQGIWTGPFGYAGLYGYWTETANRPTQVGHRWYDPTTGRFLSRDPAKNGRNWYVYCDNSPLDSADPTGLVKVTVHFREVVEGRKTVYHAYILVEDNDPRSTTFGRRWAFSGGPDNPYPSHVYLISHSGEYKKGQYDWNPRYQKPPIVLLDNDAAWKGYVDEFKRIERELAKTKVKYNVLKDNSNSWVRELLERIGLLEVLEDLLKRKLVRRPPVPGWNGDPWPK